MSSGLFELAGTCEFESEVDSPTASQLAAVIGRARRFDAWEALLDLGLLDGVVVARGPDEDRRAEQLRKLIQVGVPLLVSHPVVDSMLIYYELDMIRRETGCVVIPYLFARYHPAVRSLAEMVRQGADSPIGKIDQVLVQRSIAEPTKAAVVAQFARDVDVIRTVAGDVIRLGAMAGSTADAAYGSLGVQMSGPSGVAARWSVVGGKVADGCDITLLGSGGQAATHEPRPGQPWTYQVIRDNEKEVVARQHAENEALAGQSRAIADWDPAAEALSALARAIRGQAAEPDWVDAARAVELAETIDRSLHKGRTIELYNEDFSETGTFKGTMASLGCGLLLLGLFLMGAVGIAEQVLGVESTRFWPYLLAGLLGVFLLLQLLLLVSRRQDAPPAAETAANRKPDAR
jgi:predicted dehydrogenase